jgi:hypothetical protein
MLVYGGGTTNGTFSDMWALDLSAGPAWVAISPNGSAFSQGGYAAVYDPARDRMLLFGGYYANTYFNTVYALSLAGTPTWSGLSPAGSPPTARIADAIAFDRVTDRMLIFGGSDGTSDRADVSALYWGTPVSVGDVAGPVRVSFAVPRPNPFHARVRFEFEIPREAQVHLAIYDLAGRQVRLIENARFAPGRYTRTWDGMDESRTPAVGGVYFAGLREAGVELDRKLVLIR